MAIFYFTGMIVALFHLSIFLFFFKFNNIFKRLKKNKRVSLKSSSQTYLEEIIVTKKQKKIHNQRLILIKMRSSNFLLD